MKIFRLALVYMVLLLILLIGVLNLTAQPLQKKIALKVLYVGYEPSRPMPADLVYYSTSPDRYPEIYKDRMADFRRFLEKNFTGVETVDVRDYNTAMSDKADVTIMDAGPVKLPADFDRPMILMAAMAPNVGLPIGLKFDWYCQCLDDQALNLRTSHPVFNTPYKVKLTMEEGKTPESFFNGYQGQHLSPTMPMWKVVKEGMTSEKKYLIGMVAHGEGFDDSPDAEAISGGVCWKNAEAVSIGRHGNYFMWGFSGSPDFMTDEANQVFVNSICYIRRFDRMPAIVKKVQIETRDWLNEQMYRLDKNVYNKAIASRKQGNDRLRKMQQALRDRKAAGEDIGKGNESLLKMGLTDDVQSFEDYIKGYAGSEMFALFGTDIKAYHKFYKDNYEYYHPAGSYALQLDKDAQRLGISNRKPAILEACISLLEKEKDTALARRVLERYTMEKFKLAAEWRAWFTKNRSKLFYTEAGGFKFMVNTYGKPSVPVSEKPVAPAAVQQKDNEPTASDPVAVSAVLLPGKTANMKEVVINARILKGWHIYAYLSEGSPFITTEALLDLPAGAVSDKEWETSASVPYPGNGDVFVFEEKATFRVQVDCSKLKAGDELKCGLYYQACDITKCFQPTRKMITLKYSAGVSAGNNITKNAASQPGAQAGVSLNEPAPGFTLKTEKGADVALSSFRGKPVLVEFWASWCMPCRASIPHLKQLYGKYHAAGFNMLSVSIDASDVAWKKAVAQEKMSWQQVADVYKSGEKDAETALKYGVKAVPANFLIDANGKIIARDLQGDALDSKLSELFN